MYDLDCPTVGPYIKGEDAGGILDFLYDHGLVIPDGADFAVLADDEDEDDDSIRGEDDDDEAEDVIAFCDVCKRDELFVWLSPEADEDVDRDDDDGWDRRICSMCACWIPQ